MTYAGQVHERGAVAPHRTLGIAGESGCGASTTARLVMRPLPVTAGTIASHGRDVSACHLASATMDAVHAAR